MIDHLIYKRTAPLTVLGVCWWSGKPDDDQDRLKNVMANTRLDISRRQLDAQSCELEQLRRRERRWAQKVSQFRDWYPEACKAYDEQVARGDALEQDLSAIHTYSKAAYQKVNELVKKNKALVARNMVCEEEWKCHAEEARKAREKVKSMEKRLAEVTKEKEGVEIQNRAFKTAIEKLWDERAEMMKKLQEGERGSLSEQDQEWVDLAAHGDEEDEDKEIDVWVESPAFEHDAAQSRSLALELPVDEYEEEEEEEEDDDDDDLMSFTY